MKEPMILDHPLLQHKVSHLRDINTGTKEFKELVSEIATLMCYEATRDLPTKFIPKKRSDMSEITQKSWYSRIRTS